ncbi:MAG: DUF192 domain-containing protein [Actinobacteria bacterium]|nr:DUF192 domain-containing protein [Actinomycetota bacterium]
MRRLYSLRDERGGVICARCTIADTSLSRLRGLLGRDELEPDEGLLLTPESSVHTFFMRFPIDVVFLEADLTVLAVREHVRPWRTAGHRGSRSVLELSAGTCKRRRLRPGDRLALDDCVEDDASVMLVLRRGDDSQVVFGRGSLAAATRTISAMSELDVGVSAVVLSDTTRKAS